MFSSMSLYTNLIYIITNNYKHKFSIIFGVANSSTLSARVGRLVTTGTGNSVTVAEGIQVGNLLRWLITGVRIDGDHSTWVDVVDHGSVRRAQMVIGPALFPLAYAAGARLHVSCICACGSVSGRTGRAVCVAITWNFCLC
jgi:hypothetical protein